MSRRLARSRAAASTSNASPKQELELGPAAHKVEVLKFCEVKPFPTGKHLRGDDESDPIRSITVIGPDGIPETQSAYGYVVTVNGERIVYDDYDCAVLAAAI